MKTAVNLKPYAWLSIAAALATIALKTWAWWMTGSVGLLSDAMESLVNLAGALMALWMLSIAEQPADDGHHYGHSKAEYFSSGFEGFLILFAAVSISWAAIDRFFHPQGLEQLGFGLAISVVASLINLVTSRVLLTAGRQHRSISLEADAHHLMTDVWTSVGILIGVGAVAFTGWVWLDPLIALLVAANIVRTGIQLIHRSTAGLMDSALPPEDIEQIEAALAPFRLQGADFHALLTRQAGSRAFISVHVLLPGAWSIQRGHDQAELIEAAIRDAIPHAHVLTHIEPIDDPLSLADDKLDR